MNPAELDLNDTLAEKRAQFELPPDIVYLDGNSLGCLTVAARQRAQEVVEQQWGHDLIKSWNLHEWIDLPVTIGEKIARLVGAAPGQVICCDSISVNLFKILGAALALRPERHVVISQQSNFPTDLYIVQGLAGLLGSERCELRQLADEELEAGLRSKDVAVLLLSHVNFRTGSVYDMQRLTRLAHDHGVLVIWDLAHSAGVLPVELDAWQVDFAVGCGYKYLNGGPGAPAFLYVAHQHQEQAVQPLSGWMGHQAPFSFDNSYRPAEGMSRFLSGTPAVVSMSILDAALDVFADTGPAELHKKAQALSELFLYLVDGSSVSDDLRLLSPRDCNKRGAQLAFAHPHAYEICQALIAQGVIADFRAPDILRFGFSPLYLCFADMAQSVSCLETIVREGLWQNPAYSSRAKVT